MMRVFNLHNSDWAPQCTHFSSAIFEMPMKDKNMFMDSSWKNIVKKKLLLIWCFWWFYPTIFVNIGKPVFLNKEFPMLTAALFVNSDILYFIQFYPVLFIEKCIFVSRKYKMSVSSKRLIKSKMGPNAVLREHFSRLWINFNFISY